MKAYSTSINIVAPADAVWRILTDVGSWPEWDPGTVRIEGTIGLGEKVTAYSALSPDRAFPVKVTSLSPNQAMVWTGGMPLGLFKGVRTFKLAPKQDGTTDFEMREEFSGLLFPLMAGTLPDLTETFKTFARGLKQRAEGTS